MNPSLPRSPVAVFNSSVKKANAIAVSMEIYWYDVSEVQQIDESTDDATEVIHSLDNGVVVTAGDIRRATVQSASLLLPSGLVLCFLMEVPFE